MAREYKIPQLLEAAFGIRVYETPDTNEEADYPSSRFGTAVLDRITLNDLQLPDEIIFSVAGSNDIVKTKITGSTRKGTVKELISEGDDQVSIRGLIINYDSDKYPSEAVAELRSLLKIGESLIVESEELNKTFDIHELAIESFSFPPMEGYPNVQPFTISAISDLPIELEI